ncbi:23S rRNA (uracil(1939)-C(5))-methyltransferase RlmD [Holdemania massiliensis]|uniref:23S rRNA (uracil(1939)-C(5))-methyltransferase RlmD n=1 Tax=Holdemania massiliensis TaxID=1468449 RepID=UPI0002E2BF2E|nr:23S rRNA (uracil(1939)-C(5))-methyltransferase RlmD [Holdemania massiliensis]
MEKKKSKQSVNVTAKKLGINGEGIGYLDGKPVFVDQLLPGETAEISLIETKERYAKGRINKRLNDSPLRILPACSVQGRCSGCPLMILQPQAQLQMKRELVQEALIKYAGLPRSLVQPVTASPLPLGYRNQCKLPIRQEHGQLVSGLYEEGSNRIIPIHSCLIHDEHLEALRKQIMGLLNQFKLSAYDPKTETGLRTLVLRYLDGQFQCVLVTGKSVLPSGLIEKLKQIPELVCLMQNINPDKRSRQLFSSRWKLLAGEDQLPVQLGRLQLNLSCASFFQLNRPQAYQLYQKAASLIKPCTTLVEAYSGIGGISLMLKDKAKTIIGIESIQEAVDNANENARLNQADHVRFVCGDAAKEMKKISRKRKIDAVVVDPPRIGLDGAMIESLRQCQPEQIVYISCNPATLGKNIKELKDLYEVKTVIPFDMFPNTAHVETIVLLSKHLKMTTYDLTDRKRRGN